MADVCATTDLPEPVQPISELTTGGIDTPSMVNTLAQLPDATGARVASHMQKFGDMYGDALGRRLHMAMDNLPEGQLVRTTFDIDKTPTITLNSRYWKEPGKVDEFIATTDLGDMVAENYIDVLNGEFGKVLWNTPRADNAPSLAISLTKKTDLLDELNEIALPVDGLFKAPNNVLKYDGKLDEDDIEFMTDNLSLKATQSIDDFIAEAYSDFVRYGIDANEFSIAVGSWIQKKMNLPNSSLKALSTNPSVVFDEFLLSEGLPKTVSAPTVALTKLDEPAESFLGSTPSEIDEFFTDNIDIMVDDTTIDDWHHYWDLDNSISQDQWEAVVEYQAGSGPFNRYLRGTATKVERFDEDTTIELIAQLDGALNYEIGNIVGEDGVLVYRGVKAHVAADWQPGDVFEDAGYMSTTISQGTANEFASGLGTDGYIMHIYAPSYARGRYISTPDDMYQGEEYELLLARGTQFRILKRDDVNRVFYVEVLG